MMSNKVERLLCKKCGWVSPEVNIGMKNSCPKCKSALYVRFEDPIDPEKWKEFSRIQCAEGLQETPESVDRYNNWMKNGSDEDAWS